MKEFKSLIIVKHPIDRVWETIKERMPELAEKLPDIKEVVVKSSRESDGGKVDLITFWKADIKIPSMLHSIVDPSTLSWTDEAYWLPRQRECHWKIQTHFLEGRVECSGLTTYEPAMGGKGTKIVFSGSLDISTAGLSVPKLADKKMADTIEPLVGSMLIRNFRKVTEAIPEVMNLA